MSTGDVIGSRRRVFEGRDRNNVVKRTNKRVESGFYLDLEIFHADIEETGKKHLTSLALDVGHKCREALRSHFFFIISCLC